MHQESQNRQSYHDWLEVKISDDQSSASVIVKPDADIAKLSVDGLKQFLSEYKITHGIIEENVQNLVQNPANYIGVPLKIAEGKAPKNGKDGYIEYVYEQQDLTETPQQDDQQKVDFRNIKNVDNIKKGEMLARRISPEEGEDGVSVTGNVIKAKRGKEAPWKLGKNVVLDEEKDAIFAAIDGQVSFTDKNKLNVFPVYEVNGDVDFGVGNIDFVGTVVIRGNILAGFKVKASGDLRVYGGIEGAEIDVGGTIEATAGIAAQQKGYIRAGMDIKTSYIQNAQVYAARDVIVSQSIMHSHVAAGRNVVCNKSKGLIVGGKIQAGENVVARLIGNMMNTPTSIEVGAKPELREEMNQVDRQLKEIEESQKKSVQAIRILEQMQTGAGYLPPDKQQMFEQLLNTHSSNEQKILELQARRDEIAMELVNSTKARVEAQVRIHSGVKLVFGNYVRFIKDHYEYSYFVLEGGEIVGHPLR